MPFGAQRPLLGNFLEFFAMTSAAGYLIAVRKLSSRYDTWLLTALQIYTGMIFSPPGIRNQTALAIDNIPSDVYCRVSDGV